MEPSLVIAEESIALLEKAALEADALEAKVRQLESEKARLESQCNLLSKQASKPSLDRSLLLKVATVLENEGMLAEGMTSEKLASLYEENPNRLADIALRLLCPASAEGQPIKSASATTNSPGSPKTVNFNGREVVDHDGWLNVLK